MSLSKSMRAAAANRELPGADEVMEIMNGPSDRALDHVIDQERARFEQWMDLAFKDGTSNSWKEIPTRTVATWDLAKIRTKLSRGGFRLLDLEDPEARRAHFETFRIWFPEPEASYLSPAPELDPSQRFIRFQYPAVMLSTPTDEDVVKVTLGHLDPGAYDAPGWCLKKDSGRQPLSHATFFRDKKAA